MTHSESTTGADAQSGEVQTPCIGVCTLGPGNLCIGCFRTAEEIGNWLNFSAQDRSRIVAEIPARLDALFSK